MYEAFFGLNGRPFVPSPLVERYFPAAAISFAAEALKRCIARAEGVGLLIGPSGTGKTLLCQLLADHFRDELDIVQLNSGRLGSRTALLQAVLFALDVPYQGKDEGELRLNLIDLISRKREGFAGLLLVIDEAQTLPMRLLDELRLITNLIRDGLPRVRLLLAGSNNLEERLANPKLDSFSQRIAARCYLEALTKTETSQYIDKQIELCGGDPDEVFTEEAKESVFGATDGIPRLINQVCDHALVIAFAAGCQQIDAAGIEEAWADLQQLPTPWNESAQTARGTFSSPGEDTIEFGNLDDVDGAAEGAVSHESAAPSFEIDDHSDDAAEHLDTLEEHVSELERELVTTSSTDEPQFADDGSLEVQPTFEFEEEEIIVDRYAELDASDISRHLRVESPEGREIAAILGPMARSSSELLRVVDGSHPDDPQAAGTNPAGETTDSDSPEGFAQTSQVPEQGASPFAEQEGYSTSYGDDDVETANADVDRQHRLTEQLEGESSDDDLIIVEDDSEDAATISAPSARRQEYGQLFAKLRRG